MKGQGKAALAISAKCKSRLLTCNNSSTTKRKLRSRKAIHRKSRKPAVLPCSLNECHPAPGTADRDDGDEPSQENGGNGASGGGGGGGGNINGANGGGTDGDVDCVPIRTVETSLEGVKKPRPSENFGDDVDFSDIAKAEDNGGDNDDDDGKGGRGPRAGEDSDSAADSADSEDGSTSGGSGSESSGGGGGGGSGSGDDDDIDDGDSGDEKNGKKRPAVRHIHPCICDLSTKAQARIKAYLRERELFELRHTQRLESIDAELRAIEEEIARKQQEEAEQEELFGDKYEVVGKKKKRMKRSARRASMVSLGVKQVINWKKSPKIKVRHNQASNLRKNFTAYCGHRDVPLPEIKKIGFEQSPKIAVRVTKAASLRTELNIKKKQYYIDNEDKRPIFDTSPYY